MPQDDVTAERRRRELEAKILRVANSSNPAFEAELIAREERDRERLRHDPRSWVPAAPRAPAVRCAVRIRRAPSSRRRVSRARQRSPGRQSDDPDLDDGPLTAHELDEALELHDRLVVIALELDLLDADLVDVPLTLVRGLIEEIEAALGDADRRVP